MAVAGDRLFLAVALLQLRQVLDDDERLEAVAGHIGEGVFKNLQLADRGEFIERSEEHTSELQSLMRISYAVFCLKKKNQTLKNNKNTQRTHHNIKHHTLTGI